MSAVAGQLEKSKGLLNALDAMSNRRAFLCLLANLCAAGLVFGLVTWLSSSLAANGHTGFAAILGLLGGLFAFLIALTGASATGFILNAQLRGGEQPDIQSAMTSAADTLPRLIGVYLLLMVALFCLALAIVVLMLVCKIPFLGPILYAFVFPVSVVVMGLALYSAIYITALTGPAVWNGYTLLQAVSMLIAIACKRLLTVIVQTLLLGLLVGLVGAIVFGALFLGISATGILSMPVIGSVGLGGLAGMMTGGDGSGYAIAAMLGGTVLTAAASALPMLVAIAGYCQIYASTADGLDISGIENRIKEVQSKARAQVAAPRQSAASSAFLCPSCQHEVADDDTFCGNCGHKLR